MTSVRRWVLVTLALVAGASRADASFSPWSVGLVGEAFGVPHNPYFSFGGAGGLEGSRYLESGFEVIAHVALAGVNQPSGYGTDAKAAGTALGLSTRLGLRYLFLEESIRPYLMLYAGGLGFFSTARGANQAYVGPGAGVGIDFFVAESISIGARGTFDLFITLNQPALLCPGGGLNVTTYF